MVVSIQNWQSYLVIPFPLSSTSIYALQTDENWHTWDERLGDAREEEKENQAFFISSLQDYLMPILKPGTTFTKRVSLKLPPSDTLYLQDHANNNLVHISWFDLFIWDKWAVGLIKLEKSCKQAFTADQMRIVSQQSSLLIKRFAQDQTNFWQGNDGAKTSLLDWLLKHPFGKLGSKAKDELSNGHWTGASLPSIELISTNTLNWEEAEFRNLVIDLCCGCLPTDSSKPSQSVANQISKGRFEEWDNWCLFERRGKAVITYDEAREVPIKYNLERYYAPIFAFIQFQKVRLTDFQDRFSKTQTNTSISRSFRASFQDFRKQFLDYRISNYPMGNALYQHLRQQELIENAQKDIEDEIKNADDLERLELERYVNQMVTYITVVVALSLPATVLGSLFGVPDSWFNENWKDYFWPVVGWGTVAFSFFLLILSLAARKK